MAVTLDLNTLSDINPQTSTLITLQTPISGGIFSTLSSIHFPWYTDDENVLSNQDLCHLLIISSFLMIYMFDRATVRRNYRLQLDSLRD